MKDHWRKLAALLPLAVEKEFYRSHFNLLHRKWVKAGSGLPVSHLSKQERVKHYAKRNNVSVLVETGTYLGDMVFAMQDQFQQLFSIELSHHFYQRAVERFKKFSKVKIIKGDSGEVLKTLVPTLSSPALFWLDGHYSGGQTAKGEKECPIFEELNNILSSPFNHIIMIDDARLFVGEKDYPTIRELKEFIVKKKPGSEFALENDVFVITYK
ncbi:MAG: hypothetical protein JWR72_1577 [Flavisolibacter sp.]|jgi:hypothetical protein|nr:hypothetical protein [Flavisolibacter sp.]